MNTLKVGDVVQLRSGGAPLTVVEVSCGVCRLVCVSVGGMAQEVRCTVDALRHYHGIATPATRK